KACAHEPEVLFRHIEPVSHLAAIHPDYRKLAVRSRSKRAHGTFEFAPPRPSERVRMILLPHEEDRLAIHHIYSGIAFPQKNSGHLRRACWIRGKRPLHVLVEAAHGVRTPLKLACASRRKVREHRS